MEYSSQKQSSKVFSTVSCISLHKKFIFNLWIFYKHCWRYLRTRFQFVCIEMLNETFVTIIPFMEFFFPNILHIHISLSIHSWIQNHIFHKCTEDEVHLKTICKCASYILSNLFYNSYTSLDMLYRWMSYLDMAYNEHIMYSMVTQQQKSTVSRLESGTGFISTSNTPRILAT
jgi:hypothetical protein